MPPRRLLRKVAGYTAVSVTCGVGVTMMVDRDTMPETWFHFRVFLEGLRRVMRCAYVGLFIMLDYKMNVTDKSSQLEWDEVHYRSAKKLVMLAEQNGGLYVKAGQGFCQMNHLIPVPYWKTMASLQNTVCTRPVKEVKAVIEKEYGQPVEEVFSEFSEEPMAAASIAQVHSAILKTGETVAVKVQYIDIASRFNGDMATINFMLQVCGFVFPGYDYSTIVKKTEQTLYAELDFIQESKNSDRCGRDIKPFFGDDVVTPKVHWELTKKRVMVTSFINGCKITDMEGLQKMGISMKWAMTQYISVFAYQIFTTGFVHADPHPGNVLVHLNPKTNKPQVVVIDHGLYTEITEKDRSTIAKLWSAIVVRNEEEGERISREALGVSNFELLASIFLQFPYRSFNPFKMAASKCDLKLMQLQATQRMEDVREILDHLPNEYALVLRNISAVRASNKEVGNPVCRTALMYRYSVRESGEGAITVIWRMLLLRIQEFVADLQMSFLRYYYPEVYKAVDEMLQLG